MGENERGREEERKERGRKRRRERDGDRVGREEWKIIEKNIT